jgi:hypothetical protein
MATITPADHKLYFKIFFMLPLAGTLAAIIVEVQNSRLFSRHPAKDKAPTDAGYTGISGIFWSE